MSFEFEGKTFSSTQVIEKLKLQLTDLRINKIKKVVDHRIKGFQPVFENIYDRGNVAAAMRSAEAFGFFNFHIVEQSDAEFKTANRVTQGADKWLDIKTYSNTKSCIEGLKQQGFKVFATHLSAESKNIDEVDFSKPTSLIFGNEQNGISDEALNLCDGSVVIPMQGFSQSFNISVAAALSFYHVYSYRNSKGFEASDLTENERLYLQALYYLKSVKNSELYFQR